MNTSLNSQSLRILAADIGGTNARFAAASVSHLMQVDLGPVFTMDTRHERTNSFGEFCELFKSKAPAELADTDSFDAVALALAGSVNDRCAVLPNIDWNINADEASPFEPLFLLNDFVAQGYTLTILDALNRLEVVRGDQKRGVGSIALVGAGTGLGHCALFPLQRDQAGTLRYHVAGSEAGHASFSFQGAEEKLLEQNWLSRTGKCCLSNDDVVSGPGAAMLHELISGERLAPEQALANHNIETRELFSRFYARACRNYCLNIFPVQCLVLSGGIAAQNPHLVQSQAFIQSFNDGQHYRELLDCIPIRLNTDPHIGIRGAALYAAQQLRGVQN